MQPIPILNNQHKLHSLKIPAEQLKATEGEFDFSQLYSQKASRKNLMPFFN